MRQVTFTLEQLSHFYNVLNKIPKREFEETRKFEKVWSVMDKDYERGQKKIKEISAIDVKEMNYELKDEALNKFMSEQVVCKFDREVLNFCKDKYIDYIKLSYREGVGGPQGVMGRYDNRMFVEVVDAIEDGKEVE